MQRILLTVGTRRTCKHESHPSMTDTGTKSLFHQTGSRLDKLGRALCVSCQAAEPASAEDVGHVSSRLHKHNFSLHTAANVSGAVRCT